MSTPRVTAPADHDRRNGTAYGLAAYTIWGAFPLYFHLLAPAGAWEILAHRMVWTLVVCVAVVAARRDTGWLRPVFGSPAMLGRVALAGALIASNWGIYVAAVAAEHVTDVSLGYFVNPVVTVGLGVFVLRERLNPTQWAAVGIGLAACVYLTVDSGRPPWIALALAGTFAGYGLMKKRLGTSLGAFHSLTAETAVLAPVAAVIVVWVGAGGDATFTGHGAGHTTLLVLAGFVTAVPLLLFAAAARRVPLVTIGLLQFVAPVLQLVCGVLLGERMSTGRWVGFAVVWVALALLTADSVRSSRSRVALARAAERAAT